MNADDPADLDFTTLIAPETPAPPVREAATPEEEEECLIGAQALGRDGFHLVAARRAAKAGTTSAILIVDDDLPTGELAARVLRRAGFQAAVVGSPRDAARHMNALGAPGLLLLDVEMPEMNGFDFLARLRSSKRLSETPVILFTALSERRHVVRGLLAGADGYVAKPIAGSALVAAVRTVLAA